MSMADNEKTLSENAQRALLFNYILTKGHLPPWEADDLAHLQYRVCAKLLGITEQEVCHAFAELEDAGLIERQSA
jgi:hypothetical protein